MWGLTGEVDVDDFSTVNSEFHLDHARARLERLKIFELEISRQSRVTAHNLDLVFLSTHSSDDDHLRFENIPVGRPFSRALDLGSGAHASLANARIQFFLLYMHGGAEAELARVDRVQLAIAPDCEGTMRLPKGRLGSASHPATFPDPALSNCAFRILLKDVNVDTWDVYAAGHAKLIFEDSQIDELVARDHASIEVRNSELYADWLAVAGDANIDISDSTVGALRLASQRPGSCDQPGSGLRPGPRQLQKRALRLRHHCGGQRSGFSPPRLLAARIHAPRRQLDHPSGLEFRHLAVYGTNRYFSIVSGFSVTPNPGACGTRTQPSSSTGKCSFVVCHRSGE